MDKNFILSKTFLFVVIWVHVLVSQVNKYKAVAFDLLMMYYVTKMQLSFDLSFLNYKLF